MGGANIAYLKSIPKRKKAAMEPDKEQDDESKSITTNRSTSPIEEDDGDPQINKSRPYNSALDSRAYDSDFRFTADPLTSPSGMKIIEKANERIISINAKINTLKAAIEKDIQHQIINLQAEIAQVKGQPEQEEQIVTSKKKMEVAELERDLREHDIHPLRGSKNEAKLGALENEWRRHVKDISIKLNPSLKKSNTEPLLQRVFTYKLPARAATMPAALNSSRELLRKLTRTFTQSSPITPPSNQSTLPAKSSSIVDGETIPPFDRRTNRESAAFYKEYADTKKEVAKELGLSSSDATPKQPECLKLWNQYKMGKDTMHGFFKRVRIAMGKKANTTKVATEELSQGQQPKAQTKAKRIK